MRNLNEKCNGLHSGTLLTRVGEYGDCQEYHKHPETGELVVMNCWSVSDGQDCIDKEFEVIEVHSKEICEKVKPLLENLHILLPDFVL